MKQIEQFERRREALTFFKCLKDRLKALRFTCVVDSIVAILP